jgi:Protein of unknown function (DUF2587)
VTFIGSSWPVRSSASRFDCDNGWMSDDEVDLNPSTTAPATRTQPSRIVVIGPGGIQESGLANEPGVDEAGPAPDDATGVDLIAHPAKVMRIGSMIRQLLEEVRAAPLDEAGRARLKEIHQSSLRELESGLSPELVDELERITLPFGENDVPSESELRIAQAQLVGWLEGLFHGIQTALVAQQMAARAQLEQIRRPLPAGSPDPGHEPGVGSGMYL